MKMPLLTGAYEARSLIASAQRCVNAFPETNPNDSEFPTTHYPTPGLLQLATAPVAGFRGLYVASNRKLYAVVYDTVFHVEDDWTFTALGNTATQSGPVSMEDNSLTLVIADGSPAGYTIDLSTDDFDSITDPAFYGSTRVGEMDDFLIFNQPNTRAFYVSGALAVTFDPLDIADKNGSGDDIVAVVVVNRRIWVFGERTIEVWYNSGDATFVFERDPGVFIEHGCAAAGSLANFDTSIYWLSPERIVFRSSDMNALRISTHAIEEELRTYSRVDDAVGYCYVQGGHTFYVLSFPTADKTWCFDLATGQWHERMWLDSEGGEHRHRGACSVLYKGRQLVGDWETGALYEMTPDAYDDAGSPMFHRRSWPAISNEKKQVFLDRFFADMQVGEIPVDQPEPVVRLRWSDTRGRTWGNAVSMPLGARGNFGRRVQRNRLGRSEERILELTWSAKVRTALNGAYVVADGEQ